MTNKISEYKFGRKSFINMKQIIGTIFLCVVPFTVSASENINDKFEKQCVTSRTAYVDAVKAARDAYGPYVSAKAGWMTAKDVYSKSMAEPNWVKDYIGENGWRTGLRSRKPPPLKALGDVDQAFGVHLYREAFEAQSTIYHDAVELVRETLGPYKAACEAYRQASVSHSETFQTLPLPTHRFLNNNDFVLQFDAAKGEYPVGNVELTAPGRVKFKDDASAWAKDDWSQDRSWIPIVKDMSEKPEDWSAYAALSVTLSARQLVPGDSPLSGQRRAWITQAVVSGAKPAEILESLASPGYENGILGLFAGVRRDAVVQEISPGYRWYVALENDGTTVWQAELLDVTISGFDDVEPNGEGGSGAGGSKSYDDIKYTFTFNFDNVVDPYVEYPDSYMTWSNNMDDTEELVYACNNCPDDLGDNAEKSGYNAISRRYRGPTSYPQTVGASCRNAEHPTVVIDEATDKSSCESQDGKTSWFPHAYTVPRDKVTKLKMLGNIRKGRSLMSGEEIEIGFDDITLLTEKQAKFQDSTAY